MRIGIYEGRERGLYDVMGGHGDLSDNDYWTDIEQCGELVELTPEGEKVLIEGRPLIPEEDYIYDEE